MKYFTLFSTSNNYKLVNFWPIFKIFVPKSCKISNIRLKMQLFLASFGSFSLLKLEKPHFLARTHIEYFYLSIFVILGIFFSISVLFRVPCQQRLLLSKLWNATCFSSFARLSSRNETASPVPREAELCF